MALKKILVVNYEKEVLFEFETILARGGYDVKKTLWGEAAVVLAKEEAFDLVYCSLNMPGMNGIEVSRKISAAAPGTKVILFVVNPDHREEREIMFWKPEDRKRLFEGSCPVSELLSYTRRVLDSPSAAPESSNDFSPDPV